MKRSLTLVCMLASGLGVGSFALMSRAAAQTPDAPSPVGATATPAPMGPAKIAVIAFQQAVAQTNEGQRDFAQLSQKFAPKQAQLKALNDEVETLKKQLQDAGANLSDQERDSRLRTIDEKTKSLQRTAEDDQNDFNTAMNDMLQSLAQKVYVVVDAYAKLNGFTVVLDASNQQSQTVLWEAPSTDITKAIVDAYNVRSGVPAPTPSTGDAAPHPTTPTHPSSTTTHSSSSTTHTPH